MTCWLVCASAGAAAPPAKAADAAPGLLANTAALGSYERWLPARVLAEAERGLLHAVRQWRYRRGGHLAYDARLARAAEVLLPWAKAHAGEQFPLETLRAAAWAQGWTDGELAAVAVDAGGGELLAGLRLQLQRTLGGDYELDQVGLALAARGGPGELERHTAVVALSRRLVHLAPVARALPAGGKLTLAGRLLVPHVRGATLLVQRPDGAIVRGPAELQGALLAATLPVGHRLGALHVQLLVERGQGPEVAASFPVQVVAGKIPGAATPSEAAHAGDEDEDEDKDAHPGVEVTRDGNDGLSDAVATAGHHGSLLSLLYGLRAAHGLPLPAPTAALMRVARVHAEDMARHRFFAHVSPRTGNVTDRLRRARQPYLHVVENLAEGADADQIFAQWLQSPGHRLNLLDPRVDAVGVAAVAGRRSALGVAVLVMAALPEGAAAAR